MPQSRRRYWMRFLPRPFFSRAAEMASTAAWNSRPEYAGIHGYSMVGESRDPRRAHVVVSTGLRLHDLDDRQPALVSKLEVTFVVSRHAHDSAFAIAHQYIVGDPDLNRLPGERMQRMQPRRHALLFLCRELGFHHTAAGTLVDECSNPRIAPAGSKRNRMLSSNSQKGSAKQSVGAGGKHLHCAISL